MKERVMMTVTEVQVIALDTIEMTLEHPYVAAIARPGQFLYVLAEGHTLRRPLSIASIDRERHTVTILFKIIGEGTERLAALEPGMTVDTVGPSGNGFAWQDKPLQTALLIGGGIGVPPLYGLAEALQKDGVHVKAILGFQSREHVFYKKKFERIANTFIVTDDGSCGHHGVVTDLLDKTGSFDHYFACGPAPMLRAVTRRLQNSPGAISLEERMGCGTGACLACMVRDHSASGYKKVCSDGPVFDADEVII